MGRPAALKTSSLRKLLRGQPPNRAWTPPNRRQALQAPLLQPQPSHKPLQGIHLKSLMLPLVKMGFPREVAIAELRKCNGDANLAIANLFAKSLSEGFNKKK